LSVFGGWRREGVPHLTLVLPDGTRSLVPAEWTDLNLPAAGLPGSPDGRPSTPLLASLSDLSRTRGIVDALLRRIEESEPAAPNPTREVSHRATTTTEVLADNAGRVRSTSRLGVVESRRASESHRPVGSADRGGGLSAIGETDSGEPA
jgi:hypothetical protein